MQADQIQNPEWQFNLENNSTLAFESRLKLMHNLADKKTLTVAFHETFPGLGYVTKKGYTFDWVPAPNNNIASGVGKKCASFSRDSVFDM